jgi:hypothetical protein
MGKLRPAIVLLSLALALAAGCGGGGSGNASVAGSPAATVTSVTVSPTAPGLLFAQTQQFSATVQGTGSPSQAVIALGELAGFSLERGEGYPGWQPDLASDLVDKVRTMHEAL